jgi:probable S-adenosylmethionine-dependent methyltransferase, YraL family
MSGKLYLVGTPIGNLKDITLRALDVLKEADLIACEDTRHTKILLDAYGIAKPLLSYRKENEREMSEKIAETVKSGKSVALVTDAGMPAISDPGAVVVETLQNMGISVAVAPGPSAVTAAVSLAGLKENGFVFIGFLPEKNKDRTGLINSFKNSPLPLVFYAPPHDLKEYFEFLFMSLGDRKVTAVKEITKIHESVFKGRLSDIEIENMKGEFVLIVGPKESNEEIDVAAELKKKIDGGTSKSEAVKAVAEEFKLPKNKVYEESLRL